jgi:hypothetical protein
VVPMFFMVVVIWNNRYLVLGGIFGESSCNVFLLLFMVIWVPISVTLCMKTVLMLWHAFMFLGLRLFPLLFFLLGGRLCCFSCKNILGAIVLGMQSDTCLILTLLPIWWPKSEIPTSTTGYGYL